MTIDLNALTLESGKRLHSVERDGEDIQVRELEGIRWFHFNSPAIQSAMSVDEPEKLILPYARTMLAGFMFQPLPKSLLSLGLGGGAFERFFRKKLPELKLQSVELSPTVIEISREYFKLDSDHYSIWQGGAEEYLAQTDQTFDMIFCDIFGHDGAPPCLSDNNFYKDIANKLDDNGIAVVNLLVKDATEMLKMLQAAYPNFDTLALLDVPEDKNIILFLSKQAATPISADKINQLTKDLDVDMALLQKLIRFIPNPTQQ
ncbi:MAG: fused MFS/spermidine synthase [Gammaproteobacteria bacterium]|nr:fused MFS/spermidine synthase [Gammaproteobacteria bacterium]